MLVVLVLFFFFKQKTAYEMRISDWSSDVCSSDLFEKVGIHQIYCSPKCRQKRWSSDPQWTINRRMSAGVKSSLGDGKNGRSWETLVGYTVADLMAHLERQFLPGMSWDNRGEWHIDHIRPLCSFEFTSPDAPQFREAWAPPTQIGKPTCRGRMC